MALDEDSLQRIRQRLSNKGVTFFEKKMFGGVCFMVDEKMCCGTHFDKKTGENFLLCRIGEEAYNGAIERDDCIRMEITGRAMKGFVFVKEAGYRNNKDLDYWLQLCIDFNPLAARSRKR